MIKVARYLFSSQGKYFLDSKFQNVSLETHNQLGSLHHVSKTLSDNQIDMTFIKSRFANVWTENKKYGLDITIEKQKPQVMDKLKESLSQKGITIDLQSPIKVPWFPQNISDLDKIGKILLDVKDEVNKDHPQFTDP